MQTAQISTTTVETFLETLSILSSWIESGRQFTCYDVTKELRSRDHSVQHESTRRTVHGMHGLQLGPFASSDYGRFTTSFRTSDGRSDTAEVYRSNFDFDDYDPDQSDSAVKAVVATPNGPIVKRMRASFANTHGGTIPAPKLSVSYTNVHVDNRGRICVLTELTAAIGLKPGDFVSVSHIGHELTLSKSSQSLTNDLKVDKDGNIRIGRYHQRVANLHSSTFNMVAAGDTIKITA